MTPSQPQAVTDYLADMAAARKKSKIQGAGDAWSLIKPFTEVDRPKIRYLIDPEAARLVNACPLDLRQLVMGALLTGCRYGELAALTVGNSSR